MPDIQQQLARYDLYDSAILRHGFAPYMRDYEIITELFDNGRPGVSPGVYRCCFTHCVEAEVTTCIRDEVWPESWDDVNLDRDRWEQQGGGGFLWAVSWASVDAVPTCDENPTRAAEWTRRLGKPMHEVRIGTNVYLLRLVFHDLTVERLAEPTAS
ncbi:MAG TPA: hypothetical protein VM536_23335 [Chloroflexia bacterium]|nr:hypothetical protein [Chloroflexia bacterium]